MEPALHFAIAFALAALMWRRLSSALLAGALTLLPDLDLLLGSHRSASHSLLLALLPLAISLAIRRPSAKHPLQVLSLALAAHVLLDFATGFAPVLWPLSLGGSA